MKDRSQNLFGWILAFVLLSSIQFSCSSPQTGRRIADFNADWKFYLGNDSLAYQRDYDDSDWRVLNLPHDWSIEGEFSKDHSTRHNGGFLPAGIGWYRKAFTLGENERDKNFYIDFEGVYRNGEVWINGNYLGKRPFGYMGFRHELTPYLHFGDSLNVIAVKADNSLQPNSRWYTGSGIYRNVWLVSTGDVHVDQWGAFVHSEKIDEQNDQLTVEVELINKTKQAHEVSVQVKIEESGQVIAQNTGGLIVEDEALYKTDFTIKNAKRWSFDHPLMYKAHIEIKNKATGEITDNYTVDFGIRDFHFDSEKGFFLNGENIKLHGVNNHHDLGALGAAFNRRAAQRQLEILKEMGCNAIRMAHNPPAPGLLDLCDEMGFFVMDEAFDVWAKKKMKHDYHEIWEEWHATDLRDMVRRGRNHPSVMVWSIGNEIREQFDSTGLTITPELVKIVKEADPTRPVTCGLTENIPEKNYIWQSGALDVLSFNYKHKDYPDLPNRFPGESFIASENMSAFATRGVYNQPSDSIRVWPEAYNVPIKDPNPDYTCSAYDHVHAYWGATHEETWKLVKKLDFMSGMFIWSGFDFIGEPEPFMEWPARSSYYGVIDLCGFPKDVYYMYQSEWTDKTMLHLFPHWNWTEGETIDVWAYYNNADEVELFLNGESMGIKRKENDDLHVMWRLEYTPGELKAVSRKDGKVVLERIINTAGKAARVELTADRTYIKADGKDLSFVTVRILDKEGNLVPLADNMVNFEIEGEGFIAGVSNGYQASHEPFKASYRKAYNGMCLAIVQTNGKKGTIRLKATSDGLAATEIEINAE
ncbi:glycoside hydrolase family 2 TIM barrel-domain containing protein [Roseimarinus sediminis]|uniref:glycoside hydrolase family 2 TIM barrel-domain containing protein n=1 Tax=Roseimarinus sediminis TaxID=1610899 RepID=UPI003D1D991F